MRDLYWYHWIRNLQKFFWWYCLAYYSLFQAMSVYKIPFKSIMLLTGQRISYLNDWFAKWIRNMCYMRVHILTQFHFMINNFARTAFQLVIWHFLNLLHLLLLDSNNLTQENVIFANQSSRPYLYSIFVTWITTSSEWNDCQRFIKTDS